MSPRRKMLTKAELLQLQKLYKTDERIGEFLGGVPAYLVAYWRRKKGIPKYSLPKFSENEIRSLWERYGDDEKCGLELGLSKAAFYNWRRRYNIREKPAFLKLEQLELNFPGSRISLTGNSLYGKQTVARKILARAGNADKVEVGEQIEVEADVAVVGPAVDQVVRQFRQAGVEYVWNAGRIVIAPGQLPLSADGDAAGQSVEVREFAKRQGIKAYYDARDGNASQVSLERGHWLPGSLALGCSIDATAAGSVGAYGVAVDDDAMAELWTQGKTPITVPSSVHVTMTGRRGRGVFAKDIALYAVGQLAEEGVTGVCVEFGGSVISQMSISERFMLTNYTTALDSPGVLCPYDATVRRYLTGRTMTTYKPVLPDKDAEYAQLFQISIDQIVPSVSTGPQLAASKPVQDMEGSPVSRVVLGTPCNGRFDDLRLAAEILKGNEVHPDCQLFIVPASRSVYLEALKKGLVRIFIEARAIILPSGSEGPLLASLSKDTGGARMLYTGNWTSAPEELRRSGDLLVCSPATAAASALSASISDPGRYVR